MRLIGLVVARYRDLRGLDDVTLARRLLESRGIACTPKIVERQEAHLHIVCADGKYEFSEPLPCGAVLESGNREVREGAARRSR